MKRWNWLVLGLLVLLMVVAEYVPWNGFSAQGQALEADAAASTTLIRFGGANSLSYNPAQLTIKVGDTVTWQGNFSTHALVSDTWLWDAQWSGDQFSHTFTKPGTYHYYCQLHGGPQGVGMSGVVIVQ